MLTKTKKSIGQMIALTCMGVMLMLGCRKNNPYAPNTIPEAPEVVIEYPRYEYQRVVGDGVIMDIEGYFTSTVDRWPPDNIDRLEVYVDGKLDGVILPNEVGWTPFLQGKYRWFFRYAIRNIRSGPARSITVEVRTVRGNDSKSATVELIYDNERLRELADRRVVRCRNGRELVRMASKRIYYYLPDFDHPEMAKVVREALDFMEERLGLRFIRTEDRSRRPILIFKKNSCCGYDWIEYSKYGGLVGYVHADSSHAVLDNYLTRITARAIVCHEVGHGVGLPHDRDAGSCMDNGQVYNADGSQNNFDGLRLWPYQQLGIRLIYSVPTVHDCDMLY